jgi:GAF domain-containing protein
MKTDNFNPGSIFQNIPKKVLPVVYWLVKPHAETQDIDEKQRSELAAGFSLVIFLLTSGTLALSNHLWAKPYLYSMTSFMGVSLLAYIFSRSRFIRFGYLLLILNILAGGYYFAYEGLSDPVMGIITTGSITLILGYLFYSVRGISILAVVIVLSTLVFSFFAPPIGLQSILPAAGLFILWGVLMMIVKVSQVTNERTRWAEIQKDNENLIIIQEQLNKRVSDRTIEVHLATELGKILSQVRERDDLLLQSVNRIQETFNLYYVQIYLVDSHGRNLVLHAGSGDVGIRLKQRGHRLPVDGTSLNGRAAYEKKPIIIPDTTQTYAFRPNSLLPETRSEMCIPLTVGDRIVGVLDMQSDVGDSLNEEKLPAFMMLAGQLAIAIENAALYQQQSETFILLEEQARRLTYDGWNNYLDAINQNERIGIAYEHGKIIPIMKLDQKTKGENTYITNLNVAGGPIGFIQLEREQNEAWHKNELEIVQAVADQITNQIESLRLLDQAKRYRKEAESIARLIAREGWQLYSNEKYGGEVAFYYDHHQVQKIPVQDTDNIVNGLTITEKLKVRDEIIGEVVVTGLQTIDEKTQTIISTICERLSSHIDNLRLSEQTQEALAHTDVLYKIGQRLQSGDHFNDILSDVLNTLVQTTGTNRALFIAFDEVHQSFSQLWNTDKGDLDPAYLDVNIFLSGIHGWVMRERKTAYVSKDFKHPQEREEEFTFRIKNKWGSMWIVPIFTRDRFFGTLTLYNLPDQSDLAKQDLETAEAVAGQLAITLDNRNLIERTRAMAQRERSLRQIVSQVRSLNDPELILNAATRELGAIIGRKVTINLGNSQTDTDSKSNENWDI